jgi:hypothetical protein
MKIYIVYKEWTDEDNIVEHENKVFLNENDAKEEFNKIKEELKSFWNNEFEWEYEEDEDESYYSAWSAGEYNLNHELVMIETKEVIE